MNLTNSMKKFGIEQTFKYVYKDPETNLRKLMDWGDSFANGSFPAQRARMSLCRTHPVPLRGCRTVSRTLDPLRG